MQKLIWKISFFLLVGTGILGTSSSYASEVIYGVSPFYFNQESETSFFRTLQQRLPEIQDLGVTILWIQPVFPAAEPGQGYDTTDFFKLNPAYGSEPEFRELIKSAHRQGLRVILDVALNHTSQAHPFVADVLKKGPRSSYRSFYQQETAAHRDYAQFENPLQLHNAPFVYYFWPKLLNLNYDNPQVRKYAASVLEHWVTKYDVDGFRLDASWGPAARWPEFYEKTLAPLRKKKANLFILAEDNAYHSPLNPRGGRMTQVDAAYDWEGRDANWVSRWAFQMGEEEGETVFNHSKASEAAEYFFEVLKYQHQMSRAPVARYLQNNDTASFLYTHSREQTAFAAAATLLLPGHVLLFYGQAEGFKYPQWHLPSIDENVSLRSYDPDLWHFYKELLRVRKAMRDLSRFDAVQRQNNQVYVRMGPDQVLIDFDRKMVSVNNQEIKFRK